MALQWKRLKMLFFIAVAVVAFCFSGVQAEDSIAFDSTPLSENDMDDVHGGFLNMNGNFVYFSMDFMQLRFLSHTEPGTQNPGTYLNSLRQTAVITENGMGLDLEILQSGGSGENSAEGSDSGSQFTSEGLDNDSYMGNLNILEDFPATQVSFSNNSGIMNANIITGNNNAASIANVINLRVGFFEVQNTANIRPIIENWLLPTLY
jgi:hypothetical protein